MRLDRALIKRIKYLKLLADASGVYVMLKFIVLSVKAKLHRNDSRMAAAIYEKQAVLFNKIGVSMEEGYKAASPIVSDMHLPAEEITLELIHILAFAALKLAGFRPRNILELGTNTGQTAFYLSRLFPEAKVYTVELPHSDPLFPVIHPEGDGEYVQGTARLLQQPNIVAIRSNTMHLDDLGLPKMDLIWLDAGHEYPEVAWDHAFCVNNINPGGWIFSDDIRLPGNTLSGHKERFLHAGHVVTYLNRRMADEFHLYPKRREIEQNIIFEKYIAVLHKRA